MEAKGSVDGVPRGRDADVACAPAVFTTGRDIGIGTFVGRIADTRNAAVVNGVEDAGGAGGAGGRG